MPDEAAAQARVAGALRRMSACSRSDDQDRAECAVDLARSRSDEVIDAVPSPMRAQQAAAEARRAYVESGAAESSLLPAGHPGDHGLAASVHYQCTRKFGPGAPAGLHCPGVRQVVETVERLAK